MTVGVRPLRDGEQPILEATDGNLTVFGTVSSLPAAVLVPPVQSVPPTEGVSPVVEEALSESSDSVEILEPAVDTLEPAVATLEPVVETQGVKRKEASSSGYGAGPPKRRRHIIADEESSTPDDRSVSGAEKDLSRSPPLVYVC